MTVFIFILYVVFFSWLITKISFFCNSGLSKKTLIIIFAIKIIAGLAYAYFYQLPYYRDNADTYRFFEYSITETDILLKNPTQFFKDIFSFGYAERGNIFSGENSYWNDLKSNVIIKFLAICNVVTFKNYYANLVIFNFLFLFGLVGIFRLLTPHFQHKKILLIISIFFMPSFLFWESGLHKDGILFSAIGMIFYWMNDLLNRKKTLAKGIGVVLLLLLIFALRNFIFFVLVLCLLTWFIANGSKQKFYLKYIIVISLIGVLTISLTYQSSKWNVLQIIVNKQQEFNELEGRSKLITNELQPNITSFISYLPIALDLTFLRPHFSEIKNKSYIPAMLENFGILLLIILTLFFFKKNQTIPPIIIVLFTFSFILLLTTGYTVTFSGAIVRYKSLVYPLFMGSLFYFLDEKRLFSWVMKK